LPGFQELVVLFVIGLLILGPERLPRVAAQIGRWVGKARRTANQLRYQLEREITLADMEEKNKTNREKEKKKQKEETKEEESPGPTGAGEAPPESRQAEPAPGHPDDQQAQAPEVVESAAAVQSADEDKKA
jgi:sec-independent protein translocase protein TatB